jgi:hypothetical protein
MRHYLLVAVTAACLSASAGVSAHHSFAAVFDSEQPITVTGKVTSVEWTNPHFHFSLDVPAADGAVTSWRFEGYPPNMLVRQGWRRDVTLTPGATVTVTGWLARSEPNLGAVRNVTFADGSKLAAGPPAGTGGR